MLSCAQRGIQQGAIKGRDDGRLRGTGLSDFERIQREDRRMGTFSAKLGVRKDKEMDHFQEGEAKRNAQSLEVTGVSFKAEKEFVNEIDRNCDLERGGEERLMRSKYSKEERIEQARQFIQKNTYMRVQEYASLTGLAYSTAARELCSIASDPTSGIKSEGAKSGKLYLLAKEQ